MSKFAELFNSDTDYMRSRVINTYLATAEGDDLIRIENVITSADGINSSLLEGKSLSGDSVRIPFPRFMFKSGPLGYVNRRGAPAKYLIRKPKRRDWKIGFRASQFLFFRNFNLTEVSSDDFERLKRGFLDSLFNKYPSFLAAFDKKQSTAFSTNFALSPYTERLFYKGLTVGKVDKERRKAKLKSRYFYLENELGEAQKC